MSQMPQRYRVLYDTKSVAPNGWSGEAPFQLSCSDTSGDGYWFHADFINGWYKDAVENMRITGGGGYNYDQFVSGEHVSSAVEASCTPTDQDPDNGTSDYYTSLEMMSDGAAEADPVVSATATSVAVESAMPSTTSVASSSKTMVQAASTQCPAPTKSKPVLQPSERAGKRKCHSESPRSIGQKFRKAAAK